jgi:hypothetical protein
MSSPQASKTIIERREQLCDGGEPLHTDSRSVISKDGSLYINTTKFGETLHELSAGDSVTVEVHDAGIVIVPGDSDE